MLAATPTTITVRLKTVEYPRFLSIREAAAGPLIVDPEVSASAGGAAISFTSNVDGRAMVRYGPHPGRSPVRLVGEYAPGALLGEYYHGTNFETLILRRMDARVDFDWNAAHPAPEVKRDDISVRWTGTLSAPSDGEYAFYTDADDGTRLWVDETLIIDDWTPHGVVEQRGQARLRKGQATPVRLEYFQGGGGAAVRLSWSAPGGQKETIAPRFLAPPDAPPPRTRSNEPILVRAKEPAEVRLDGMHEGEGVLVTLSCDGLEARWPNWDWDTAGVLGFAPATATTLGNAASGARMFPTLEGVGAAARRWSVELPARHRWQGPDDDRSMRVGEARVRLRAVTGKGLDPAGVLPATAPGDRVDVKTVVWQGAAAWRIDLTLDATAHPDLTELRQRMLVAPVADTLVVLSVSASAEAFEAAAGDVAEIEKGFAFE